MNAPVTWDLQEGVALIRMAAGPVNALGPDLRRMLSDALDTALADAAIHAIVLTAEGRGFSAGANSPSRPRSPAICPPRRPIFPICRRYRGLSQTGHLGASGSGPWRRM